MIVNHDCIRALLLALEQELTGEIISSEEIEKHPLLTNFNRDDIFYSSEILFKNGFIVAASFNADNEIQYYAYKSITPQGHEYLDNIRDSKV